MEIENKEKKAEDFYNSLLEFTESLFIRYNVRQELDFKSIQEMVRLTCELLYQDRNQIVYVMQTAGQYKNPHVSHSARSCLIAIIIGLYLKMPRHQLIELGIAGLLCNISVINLSDRIYTDSEGGLDLMTIVTEEEKRLLYVHPIHAYGILKALDFSLPICEAVLQHHEMEDGSGFPRELKGNAIGLYGKILVVAGFFDAFSMKKDEGVKCGHSGIVKILQNTSAFDVSVVRALVNSISIYPIGIYILLSDGRRGQVVDIDQENPRFPIVEIFGEEAPRKIIKTSEELFIDRPLTSEEVDAF
jgi:HD-GYP domain-containing protein (c-di-GMP phosphodiesterase class II)